MPDLKNYTMKDGCTQSLLRGFDECRKRTHFTLDGWQTKREERAAPRFGSLIHHALMVFYRALRAGGAKNYPFLITKGIDQKTAKNIKYSSSAGAAEKIELEGMQAKSIARQYVDQWEQDIDQDWLLVEDIFDVNFRGYRLRGKLDIVRRKGNKLWIYETKTTSRFNEAELTDKLAFDFQCLFYITALELMILQKQKEGDPAWQSITGVGGVQYNVIHKPMIKQKKNESDAEFASRHETDMEERREFYFRRYEMTFPDEVREEFAEDLEQRLEEFHMWLNDELLTRKMEHSCFGFWPCEFVAACASNNMVGYERKRVLFRELQEEDDAGETSKAKKKKVAKRKIAKTPQKGKAKGKKIKA